jgi:phytol kinase
MLTSNYLALAITFIIAILWLRLNDILAHRGLVSSQLSRKIIHVGTGPIFVMCWVFFPDHPAARYLAALVPFAITAQFALVGLGVIKDEAAVTAMSRTGDRREILRGPLFYGIVFVLITIACWLDNPIGMVALMMLCGGDGLADILGKRIRSPRLPWSPGKSLAGTAAMFFGGWLFAIGVVWFFLLVNVFSGSIGDYVLGITVISAVATLVESLPLKDVDNLTVPAVSVLLGYFFL